MNLSSFWSVYKEILSYKQIFSNTILIVWEALHYVFLMWCAV